MLWHVLISLAEDSHFSCALTKGPREVKKILTRLVNEEVLEFWSSGSTTMYGLKGAGKQAHTEGED